MKATILKMKAEIPAAGASFYKCEGKNLILLSRGGAKGGVAGVPRCPELYEGMSLLCQSGTEQWCPPARQPLSERQARSPSVCCLSNRLLCIQLRTPPGPARMQISAGSALPPPRLQRCHVPPFPWAAVPPEPGASTKETTALPPQAQEAGTAARGPVPASCA